MILLVVLGCALLGVGKEMGMGLSGTGLLLWDISPLAAALEDAGYPGLEGSLFLYGGMGIGGGEVRFGGGGFGGEVSVQEGDRSARLGMGFGGAIVEIPVLDEGGFIAAVGLLGGGGGVELLLRSRVYASFDDGLEAPSDLSLSRALWAFLPYVAVEVWVAEWFGIRVMAGNLITVMAGWDAGGVEFPGPPESFGGPFFSFGLAFGGRSAPEGPAD